MGPLIIRADASPAMGVGHVMRCLALAQAWQDAGGQAAYVMAARTPAVEERLRAENMAVCFVAAPPGSTADAALTAGLARQHGAEWLVLDGYHFDGDYQRAIKQAGLKLLVLDDYGHAEDYWADVVLNQDLHAEEALYHRRQPYTRLLLGPQYVLLRREFVQWPRQPRVCPPVARRLLVTMGGGDPDNVTLRAIEALQGRARDDLEAAVVIGAANPHQAELSAAARKGPARIRLLQNVRNMPDLMAWCDMALSAGGSTLWELALFAVPSMVLILAENQEPSTRILRGRGACLVVEGGTAITAAALAAAIHRFANDFALREACAVEMGKIVDGRGAHRVAKEIA